MKNMSALVLSISLLCSGLSLSAVQNDEAAAAHVDSDYEEDEVRADASVSRRAQFAAFFSTLVTSASNNRVVTPVSAFFVAHPCAQIAGKVALVAAVTFCVYKLYKKCTAKKKTVRSARVA